MSRLAAGVVLCRFLLPELERLSVRRPWLTPRAFFLLASILYFRRGQCFQSDLDQNRQSFALLSGLVPNWVAAALTYCGWQPVKRLRLCTRKVSPRRNHWRESERRRWHFQASNALIRHIPPTLQFGSRPTNSKAPSANWRLKPVRWNQGTRPPNSVLL